METVGLEVGNAVGTVVGCHDGSLVVGCRDGSVVGMYVGPFDGVAVGAGDGLTVGFGVGCGVGCVVGTNVGDADGPPVGNLVGLNVGKSVGKLVVGVVVGALELGNSDGADVGGNVVQACSHSASPTGSTNSRRDDPGVAVNKGARRSPSARSNSFSNRLCPLNAGYITP